ncbi:MAG: hypothetical protein B0W54_05135 [Cellvibrio sp. 79]|nr:MAG: hypothetical protein B0W54_05135 [Cellvibrio sp. 79]
MNSPVQQHAAFIHPRNMVECLSQLAKDRPDDVALVFLQASDNGCMDTIFTYRQFEQSVRALAADLQRQFSKGDRLLILLENSDYYAISMFACFYAGLIAVPAFPPESKRPQHMARLVGMASDAQAIGILTTRDKELLVGALAEQLGKTTIVTVDTLDLAQASTWCGDEPSPDEIAFLQYTSGSTSAPKGVMVTHRNLVANGEAIREGLSIGPGDIMGVWSPLFHDMGMIGGLLQPFYSGIPCVLCSPNFFLERPVRWLEMISQHGVTVSGGPDFAYRLCLDRIKDSQLEKLDLSKWRLAYTGSEPVRSTTMQQFSQRFSQAGFNPAAVYPCYGLAEATLFVTGGKAGAGMTVHHLEARALAQREVIPALNGVVLVANGVAPTGHSVLIMDTDTCEPVKDDQIGEVWASGPSIAAGYWNKPESTADTFVEHAGRRWLRTGDFGFLHKGQLVVTGRLKDMIILRGHNLYPQDLEQAIEVSVEAVRNGRVAAFAVDNDGVEAIGVAAEVSFGLQKLVPADALCNALSIAVSEQCGEAPALIVLLNPGAMPKTTSGKLQRQACRQGALKGILEAYAVFKNGQRMDEPTAANVPSINAEKDELVIAIAELWAKVLSTPQQFVRSDNFFVRGGNSLHVVELASGISRAWQLEFSPSQIFEFPSLGEMADALREQLKAGKRTAGHVIPHLSKEQRAQPLPLSFGQERQWMSWKIDPQGNADHVGVVLMLKGHCEQSILRKALEQIIAEHEVLRTVFTVDSSSTPRQQILSQFPLELTEFDAAHLSTSEQVQQLAENEKWLIERPFDLTRGPLLRVGHQHVSSDNHRLVVVMHHIVSDGVSMRLLIDEIGRRYELILNGSEALPQPNALHYADYAVWQRSWLQAGEGQRQLAWWREQLGESHPVLELPTDRPRTMDTNYVAGQHDFTMPSALVAELRKTLAERKGVTLFAQLLAAYQILLYRYTGQNDIRVGTPVANRLNPEVAGILGFFVNTLALRAQIDGRMSSAQVLDQVFRTTIAAQARQDLPFEQLVEALRPVRNFGQNPLVQVTINYLTNSIGRTNWSSGLALETGRILRERVRFELTLDILESPDGSLELSFVYAKELFEPATIALMARHYLVLVNALMKQPDIAVADIDLLTDVEHQQLATWRSTPSIASPSEFDGQLAHHLIEHHVRRQPDAPAIIKGDELLTYQQLNARANRLALRLQQMGVGPESRVGISVERSIDMVVGFLAILKAGGAYVPLDPEYPAERLSYMVQDSGIRLLLSQQAVAAKLSWLTEIPVLMIEDVERQGSEPCTDVLVDSHPDNLAYVIYTSGSTGRPKGVEVAHGPLRSHLESIIKIYGVDRSHRELFFSSLSFDAAVEQWMAPLCGGGSILLCDREQFDVDNFVALAVKHEATALHLPPAYIRMLIPKIEQITPAIRTCVIGGEALPWTDCEALKRVFGNVRLVNAYGPTETIITPAAWVSAGTVLDRADTAYAPIGVPVAGRKLYVLDEYMNLVRPGTAGELYVGGYEVARCYTGQPGQTASRFVADPFSDIGGRLYRTGDKVRWLGNGQLEFLGRVDRQLKIRGFRIELGEIESQLLALPGVREGVIHVREDNAGKRILGYVCPAAGVILDTAKLRAQLRESLPDYMVPSAITVLDHLPLTPNGKIDRDALPAPVWAASSHDAQAMTGITQQLHALWCEVLDVPRIGLDDNFFDMGGHSVLLIRLHSLLKERLDLHLSVIDLFRYPTLGSLVESLRTAPSSPASGPAVNSVRQRAQQQRQHFLSSRKK